MIEKKSANVLVFNGKGELALQLRAAHDDSYPLHWDFSAAGGIDEGESPEDAAQRELLEEIGVYAQVEFVAEQECIFQDWATREPKRDYFYLYRATFDGQFSPAPNEVQEVRFFSLADIAIMIEAGEKFHPEFKMCWESGLISKAAHI